MNGLDIICTICLAELALSDMPMQVLDCGHVFQKDCVEAWLNTSMRKCPICKQMCSKEGKRPIYLSSQPAFESIINNLRFELSDEMKKAHEELQKSMEERIHVLEKSLLKEIVQIHENFNRERRQVEIAKQDWLHSYTQLQTVVVVLAAFIVFIYCMKTLFPALVIFFMLVEEAVLSKEKELQRLMKDAANSKTEQ
ncbi:hypothetical protein MBANPS3_003349 [Mucor bainieri]